MSACLLGERCRYDGALKDDISETLQLLGLTPVAVCPEVLGGLAVPRPPSEIRNGSGRDVWLFSAAVINKEGRDVTNEFMLGAVKTLSVAMKQGIKFAVLKSKSPSCGVHEIYDGDFSGRLVEGMGVCAYLLWVNGIVVMDEKDLKNKNRVK